jgi:hypothetical protein
MVNTVIMVPDCVLRVMCQRMAYCTTIEPKIVSACPVRKNTVFLFQFMFIEGYHIIIRRRGSIKGGGFARAATL